MSLDKAVRVHRRIRDARAELKRDFEKRDAELKEQMKQIEAHMHWVLEDQGAKSIRTEEGLVYTEEQMKASISDWGEFGAWAVQNDAVDFLQRRLVIGEVKQYLQDNDDLPPGVSIHRERVVRVRK